MGASDISSIPFYTTRRTASLRFFSSLSSRSNCPSSSLQDFIYGVILFCLNKWSCQNRVKSRLRWLHVTLSSSIKPHFGRRGGDRIYFFCSPARKFPELLMIFTICAQVGQFSAIAPDLPYSWQTLLLEPSVRVPAGLLGQFRATYPFSFQISQVYLVHCLAKCPASLHSVLRPLFAFACVIDHARENPAKNSALNSHVLADACAVACDCLSESTGSVSGCSVSLAVCLFF